MSYQEAASAGELVGLARQHPNRQLFVREVCAWKLERLRRKLMLAAADGGIEHAELGAVMGRSRAWATGELNLARREATKAS